jgi:hypothetical protein
MNSKVQTRLPRKLRCFLQMIDIITTFGSINNTSFDSGQNQNNESLGAKGEDTFQRHVRGKKIWCMKSTSSQHGNQRLK